MDEEQVTPQLPLYDEIEDILYEELYGINGGAVGGMSLAIKRLVDLFKRREQGPHNV